MKTWEIRDGNGRLLGYVQGSAETARRAAARAFLVGSYRESTAAAAEEWGTVSEDGCEAGDWTCDGCGLVFGESDDYASVEDRAYYCRDCAEKRGHRRRGRVQSQVDTLAIRN